MKVQHSIYDIDLKIDEVRYFKFIAHELAHLWWFNLQNASTWEE